MIPSFLYKKSDDTTASISFSVLDDLHLTSVFSNNTIKILMVPGDADIIKKRQELFELLLNDAYSYENLLEVRAAVNNLAHEYLYYSKSDDSYERMFLRIRLCDAYVKAVSALAQISGVTRITCDISSFWHAVADDELYKKVKYLVSEVKRHLDRQPEFDICISDTVYVTSSDDTASYFEELVSICDVTNGEHRFKKKSNIRPNAELWRAFESLESQLFRAMAGEISDSDLKYIDALISYKDELNFCFELLELVDSARKLGIAYTFPLIADDPCFNVRDIADIELIHKNIEAVTNDIAFDSSPFYFITGANGGGKTTFLRAVGGNLILFLSGCPILGRDAVIYPFRNIFTHFPSDECLDCIGRYDSEHALIGEMLERADNDCMMLLNETFSGTNETKGEAAAGSLAETLCEKGIFSLFVTHFLNIPKEKYPFLYAVVDKEHDNTRTYKIIRCDSAMSSHATDILKKYRLDKASLKERLTNGS